MKEFLVASNAFQVPSIFMTAGKEEEILAIRDKLNRDMFYDCRDIHSLAKTFIVSFSLLHLVSLVNFSNLYF